MSNSCRAFGSRESAILGDTWRYSADRPGSSWLSPDAPRTVVPGRPTLPDARRSPTRARLTVNAANTKPVRLEYQPRLFVRLCAHKTLKHTPKFVSPPGSTAPRHRSSRPVPRRYPDTRRKPSLNEFYCDLNIHSPPALLMHLNGIAYLWNETEPVYALEYLSRSRSSDVIYD